jgi:hypothetical protein
VNIHGRRVVETPSSALLIIKCRANDTSPHVMRAIISKAFAKKSGWRLWKMIAGIFRKSRPFSNEESPGRPTSFAICNPGPTLSDSEINKESKMNLGLWMNPLKRRH